MRRFLQDHSLSIVLAFLYAVCKIAAAYTTPDDHYLYATLHGHSDDILGALIIVVFTKRLRERGSPASK